MDFSAIKLLVLDVDGVLTDGGLFTREDGGAEVAFHVRDGLAIQLWQWQGGCVAIISGRVNPVVSTRARELGIKSVHTGVRDKSAVLKQVLTETQCDSSGAAFVGDDVPDIAPMRRCGFSATVADASPIVKQNATYIARRSGGRGAVAEVIEFLLRKQGKWAEAVTIE